MSNVGQAVLDIVGAIVGAVIGYATGGVSLIATGALYGLAGGAVAGQLLFPTVLPPSFGPRLTDHGTTTSALGDPVVIGYGTFMSAGTVMFLDKIVETPTTTTTGGKGGSAQTTTTYSYTQSIGIGLCECTDMDGNNTPIFGLQRVWESGELVYDTRPQQPGEAAADYSKRVAKTVAYSETFVLYLGTEDQEPDPTIQLQQGANTLSYLGLSYIMYPARALRSDQGLRHPTFKFELLTNPSSQGKIIPPTFLTGANNADLQTAIIGVDLVNGKYYVFNATADHWAILGFDLVTNTQFAENDSLTDFAPLGGVGIGVSSDGYPIVTWFDTDSSGVVAQLDPDTLAILNSSSSTVVSGDWQMYTTTTASLGLGPQHLLASVSVLGHVTIIDTTTLLQIVDYAFTDHPLVAAASTELGTAVFWVISNTPSDGPTGGDVLINKIEYSGDGLGGASTSNTQTGSLAPSAVDPAWTWINTIGSMIVDPDDGHIMFRVTGGGSGATNVAYVLKMDGNGDTPDWVTAVAGGANYNYVTAQNQISNGIWWLADNPPDLSGYYSIDISTGEITVHSLSSMESGSQIGAQGTSSGFSGGAILSPLVGGPAGTEIGWTLLLPRVTTPGQALVADIVANLCLRSGLTTYDVSSLGSSAVDGYAIASSPMFARDAIVPLRSVAFFDSCESGDVMKFVKRGGAPAMTLVTTDLGAYETATTDDPAPANVVVIQAESDLPFQIRLSYTSPSRDYQAGQQLSPSRFDTKADTITDVQLGGVCFGDNQAAQTVEIIWNDAWASDHSYSFTVDQSKAALEPTDVVLLPMVDTLVRVRIISINDASQVLRAITAISDDDGAYVSSAISAPVPYPVTMRFYANSALILMDTPLLLDSNDTNRTSDTMYSAVYPDSSDTWAGAAVLESDTGGATYALAAMASAAPATGAATSVLGDVANPFITDTTNSVTIRMRAGATLPSSVTTLALLNGANPAALLDPSGTVELFQFRDVTVISADTITLSYLLRGRRGSDTMTGGHAVGSRLVMLDVPSAIEKIDLRLSDLGLPLLWKAVGSNDTPATAPTVAFSPIGRALMPYAPVHLRATTSSGNVLVDATRRARIGAPEWVDMETDVLPLAEDTESYSLDVYKDGAVIRTINGSSLPITYLAADIVTDFGSIPAFLDLALYQVSTQVGRGFAYLVHAPLDQDIEATTSIPSVTPTAVAPSFSPGAGSYSSSQTVTLTSPTVGVAIYYTTDGSTPDGSSTLYSSPFNVGASETVKAIAIASGYADSGIAIATYVISTSGGGGTAAETPTLSPSTGTYDTDQTVTIASATSGSTIYYTIDGSTPTTASLVYSAPLTVATTTTVQAIAVKSGLTNSPVGGAIFTLQAAAPSIAPPTGPTGSMQTITITSGATPSETIYYTTDGSTPSSTHGSTYSGTFSVDKATVVKAIAYASGFMPSVVVSNFVPPIGTLTISIPPDSEVPEAAIGDVYELILTVTGLVGTADWTIDSGDSWWTPPTALDATHALLSDTPTATSTTPLVVRCTDLSNGNFGTITL